MGIPGESPVVYVVNAKDLKKEYDGVQIRKYACFSHDRPEEAMEPFRDNWQPLVAALTKGEAAAAKVGKVALPAPDLKPFHVPQTSGSNSPFGTVPHPAFGANAPREIVRVG